MGYGGYSYIDEEYEVDPEGDLVTFFWVEGREKLERMAEGLAAESSVGTWTQVSTMNTYVWENLRARVFRIHRVSETSGFVWIAYPFEHFEEGNLLQILASVRGNVFGMKEFTSLRMLDISLPPKLQRLFRGPRHGVEGIRRRGGTESERRPHLGTIVKPKVGLNPREFAEVAYEAYMGGVDFVKDDENLVDQRFCPFSLRVQEMMEVLDRVKDETGRRVMYSPNVTGPLSTAMKRIEFLEDIGHDTVMLDVYMMGMSALMDILEMLHEANFYVHAHRAGYAAEARGEFGVDFRVFAKLWRLLGVDQLHTGTGVGKMEGGPALIAHYAEVLRRQEMEEDMALLSLPQRWLEHIKPVMPVASGGLNPGHVAALLEIFGPDVVIQAGGGIHGHPRGTRAGAAAMRQAVEAAMRNAPPEEWGEELREAVERWGIVDPAGIRRRLAFVRDSRDVVEKAVLREGYWTAVRLWRM